jgi:ribosomal protein L32
MKCSFCGEEIADNTPVCPWCGRKQQGTPETKHPSNSSDTGWKCKNCGNFNVRTDTCPNCGKPKEFVPEQSQTTEVATPKQSKADELYGKGMDSFIKIFGESDKSAVSGHLTRAQGYLTMAYKAAGDNIEEKKGIAGLMALILTNLDDCKNAETWAKAEFTINPENVFARLAWYHIELDKLIGHKGFVTQADGSGFGLFASILTTGVDVGRVQSKKNAVKTAAIEAAKAIEKRAKTETDPNPAAWLLWSVMLMGIIENMWHNNMKEPYLCNVILNLPWNRFSNEQIKDIQEIIEEMQVEAHGYLGRLK